MRIRIGVASAAAVFCMVFGGGCHGSCGLFLPPSPSVGDGGAVTFAPTTVGQSEKISVPIADMTDDAETITHASIAGPNQGAFQILTTLPLTVPVDGGATIELQFAPSQVGAATAQLTLTTDEMGPAEVPLNGTGVAAH